MAHDPDQTATWAKLYSYKLGRAQLDRLFTLATEGFDPTHVTFETMQHQTLLRRGSLEDLVQAVDSLSPERGNGRWENLTFEAQDDSRRVLIQFERPAVTLWTSGTDAIWAHGQAARIRAHLEAGGAVPRDPVAVRNRWERALMLVISAGMTAVLLWAFLLASAEQVRSYLWFLMGPLMVGALCGVGSATMDPTFGWRHGSFLNVSGEVTRSSWWEDQKLSNKIAMGALAAAVVASVAAVGSTYADLR
ncbi:hypothetical protein [Streptomyces sp. NPDC050982]|uniref:hypothetical protein n=1 Tax=Streptomyces sp. NPDC050982 TaxID=3154746 RepID=UPI0033C87C1D